MPSRDKTTTSKTAAHHAPSSYPAVRMRRNRKAPWARRLVTETTLSASDLVWPMFVLEGVAKRVKVDSMPGVERLSIDLIVEAARLAVDLGIPAIAL
ncbi:MAG: porphobilinogen synthase, partial [Hyphomicrobium sp.]